jgi:ABC-type transport system involved in cytochrome c biogenesis ATPase subunit
MLKYRDDAGLYDIGQVKIGRFGMGEGQRTEIPEEFGELGDEYFSLGQDDSYYLALRDLGDEVREAVLRGLRDAAFDTQLLTRAVEEDVFQTSLMRGVSRNTITWQFHRIATGGAALTPYRFAYKSPPPGDGGPGLTLSFRVEPDSRPPTNIHALIGSNGVGKTRLLNRLARTVADGAATPEETGTVTQLSDMGLPLPDGSAAPFANLVSVCFSVFDPFTPISQPNGIEHTYVSINRPPDAGAGPMVPKDREALMREFLRTVQGLTGPRRDRWEHALATLETDPLFRDAETSAGAEPSSIAGGEAHALFENLSSGHKIVLLAITHLADRVAERTLVLIDEPETHLHPPLLSAFIRAVSDLLTDRNGVAIIATHSPVVLQETPRICVWKLRRSGSLLAADQPEIETFGENVGILTREAFGLEVTQSGFHREIQKAVDDGLTYEEVLERFRQQLGSEARGVARALIAARDRQGQA